MSWPLEDDDVFMPVRDGGDPGGTQERVMMGSVGSLTGVFRREDDNLDGTSTTLFTRLGRPVFETSAARSQPVEVLYRGFVAKNPQTGYAVLFDPYTLTILRTSFSPAKPTYYVQDFATTWGVPSGDTTNWYDVALFDGTAVKINAKAMPTLQVTANHSFAAIPYIIERSDPANRYGGPDQNNTEKRVFAVGRSDVQEWGSGSVGTVQTLTPTTPRTDGRALTIGQRVDDTTDTAWLGQLYYTGASWDSFGGGWYFTSAEVQMLLASAYLVKVAGNANVDMTPPSLASAGTSSGTISTGLTLPDTYVGMTGVAELRQDSPYDGSRAATVVVWGFDTQILRPLQGALAGNYSRLTYTGSQSGTATQSGMVLTYSGANTKYWDNRSEHYTIDTQWVPMATDSSTYTQMNMGATTDTIFYSVDPSAIPNERGKTERYVDGGGAYPDLYHVRDYEIQTASFTVSIPLCDLVSISMSREASSGQKVQLSANDTYYPPYFAPYYYHETGMGSGGRVELNYDYNPGSDTFPVGDTYKQNPSPPPNQLPSVIAEVEALRAAMRDAHMAAIYYDDESSSGYTSRPYGGSSFYYASLLSSVDALSQTLTWQTKDFILFDEDNGVYISIDGDFSGQDTVATLTVIAKIQTRHHTTTIQLGQWSYTYAELLPEREIGTTGKYAVPSPQIRAIFAPLYQEQGSFHGAHYVTAAEESNGATPFHGFNFLLRLGTYGDFSTCNENNAESKDVYFVPCNLLEMLYAFVFSTEMGVAESGDRYPVTYASRYTQLVNELFIAHRISVSDGVQTNWTDQLGPQFSSISNTTLHRV